MTKDPKPNLDDDVTLAAADRTVREIRADVPREQEAGQGDPADKADKAEMSVWTTEADSPAAAPSADPGLADEPTVIRGFGDDPTTPLPDGAKAHIAALQQAEVAPAEPAKPRPAEPRPAKPKPAKPKPAEPAVPRRAAASGPSLIDGVAPPGSATSFFELDEIAPESSTEALPTRRGERFPIGLLVAAVLVVAATITIVLAVLLGTSAL